MQINLQISKIFRTFVAEMRRVLFIIWCLTVTRFACAQSRAAVVVPEDSVRSLCAYMVRTYPKATLQDLYKTCYQDFFGPGHLISDTAAAKQYIRYELEQCAAEDLSLMPANEPTGFWHRFVRANLGQIIDGKMTEEALLEAFLHAANSAKPVHDNWLEEWIQIEHIALQVHPEWRNEKLQAALRKAASNNQAVRHSDAFRTSYFPHYRIIPNNN